MKPKLNILKKQVECSEPLLEDFPSLKGCSIAFNTEVFDATCFCEEAKIEEPDYSMFYSKCSYLIDAKLKSDGLKLSEIFYKNKDGHTLIHTSIALIYMQCVMPELSVYFYNLLITCLVNGIAFSDSFAIKLAAAQLPDDVLNEIINSRNNATE